MGTISTSKLWPGATIPFQITFPNPSVEFTLVQQAIAQWNATTSVQLIPRSTELDFVSFDNAPGPCGSPVGRQTGRQTVACNNVNISVATILHEIGHAAGMYHEQSRYDRNAHVNINLGNVVAKRRNNFAINETATVVGDYDFLSLMHYPPVSGFEVNPAIPTITCPAGACPAGMGFATTLSATDILALNLSYQLNQSGIIPFTIENGFWGTWRQPVVAPPGYHVTGMRTRFEKRQGGGDSGDDTALNGIMIRAEPIAGVSANAPFMDIMVDGGYWGDWQPTMTTIPNGTTLAGLAVRLERKQGGAGSFGSVNDDTAANGVQMIASNGNRQTVESGFWGGWRPDVMVPTNHTVVGMQVRVEPPQGGGVRHGDDTALNGIRLLLRR